MAQGMFRQFYGLIQIHNINITNCKDDSNCVCRIMEPNNYVSVNNSSFKNNTADDWGLTCKPSNYKITIFQCNIIEQNCRGGVIEASPETLIDTCVIKDNNASDNIIFNFQRTAVIKNSYVNNPEAQSISGVRPTTVSPLLNDDEIGLELYSTAQCKAGKPPKMNVLKFLDYEQFAEKFCETFINRNGQGLPSSPILNSYFILMASDF